jgi:beta-1,4-N-acetylglucosaminyltransferase
MIKECLITTGATAKFPELIQAALAPECLQAFADNGFTHLNFQCGETFSSFNDLKPVDTKGLDIKAFDFNKNGLNKEMRACQEKDGVSKKGLLICHAGMMAAPEDNHNLLTVIVGAGTILDGMRLGLSLIVVPNATLLDNHQDELAEELEKQGYATKSDTRLVQSAFENARN